MNDQNMKNLDLKVLYLSKFKTSTIFFYKIREIIFLCIKMLHKENMFTI